MFEWTSEQKMLIESVESFAKAELDPVAEALDANEGFNEKAFRKLGEMGLLGITAESEYGGSELGALESTLVMESLAKSCASTALSYLAHSMLFVNNLSQNGSQAQKEKYLPDMCSGKTIGAMGMTEPGAGSDALGMQTKAEKKGDKYILNGMKTFITNGPIADVLWVYAKTGPGKKDLTTFIIEKDFPGFSVGKKLKKMGMRASPTSELIFDNCEVPVECRVGEEGQSVSHMMKNLNIERITISGISLGIASRCTDYTLGYIKERTQFGKSLSEFQMVQERIAEMQTKVDAGRALTYLAAKAFDKGSLDLSLGAKSKLFTAQLATQVALDAIQLLGGYGYIKEYPVERYMRDAKLMEIGAGTNEIMRVIIAKEMLKG